jgi:hypothetical protein
VVEFNSVGGAVDGEDLEGLGVFELVPFLLILIHFLLTIFRQIILNLRFHIISRKYPVFRIGNHPHHLILFFFNTVRPQLLNLLFQ